MEQSRKHRCEEKETPEGKIKGFKRVKAEVMERTGEMGERLWEIKRKQSKERDGQIGNREQQQKEKGGARS